MRQSSFPNFIRKEFPRDEEASNARILIRAGFVEKVMAGVYTYLPLGLRVIRKIEAIVRRHMNALGAHEILMPALTPKEAWMTTGRWETFDALFKIIARDKREYALGATHEEIVVPTAQRVVFSYKDLPLGLYQIQVKFRDEPRPKSGLLRGREFIMKDLYSFHADTAALDRYYRDATGAYTRIFKELGLSTYVVEASGGTFSKFSHEFQVFHPNGEDTVVFCPACNFAQNSEINTSGENSPCPLCAKPLQHRRAIEVGNIFRLGTKYSEPFSMVYKDTHGVQRPVVMGCYGMGISRLMGTLAEVFCDDRGLTWPQSVAPFDVYLIALFGPNKKENTAIAKRAQSVYQKLTDTGIEALFDDRIGPSAGEKFAESDLVGIPLRLVVSVKTGTKIELKERTANRSRVVDFSAVQKYCKR